VTRLESLGWNPFFEQQLNPSANPDLRPARVFEEQRGSWGLWWEGGACRATAAGRLRHEAGGEAASLPCVGDWVVARIPGGDARDGAVIHRVLLRKTRFSRQDPGSRTAEQVVAANVDTVFLVQSLNRDLNVRRLERYLALLWESGAVPVVVLSKADLRPDADRERAAVERAASGAAVHAVSALTPEGLDPLLPYLAPGRTAALVGSSGVGKSTIVNRLAGEELMRVREIRDEDDRGRHTTTSRRIVRLPDGGLLLDTPGMRTVLLWEGEEGLAQTFEDVESVAAGCRFRDCTHQSEPGCAVRAALENGSLDSGRYASYGKLQREIRHQAMKTDRQLRLAEQRRWKRIHLEARRRPDKRSI
jgi:ribosome biogenesis GTPase / thiamine phosphate phosphatase